MPLNDLDLIDEIRAGSRAAFNQLIERHEQFVYRVAWSFTKENQSALDISQNVFIKVHRKLDSFHGRSTFRTWLVRITQNESHSWLTNQKRHIAHAAVDSLPGIPYPPRQESTMVQAERSRNLQDEIQKLNPRQQKAVLLRYFQNMPTREIGDVLECSEGQVKNILFRSLKKLRNNLSLPGRWNQELKT